MERRARPKRAERRALSHVGGRSELSGDAKLGAILARALDVDSDERLLQGTIHGFHAYTARMHPLTARALVHEFSPPRGTVLDPFCGSGTVLVEAMLAGRRALGVDANPLAVEITRLKTRHWGDGALRALVTEADGVAAAADERRRAKAGATRNYGAEDRAAFDPHVLFELDGLRAAIEKLPGGAVRDALWLSLSSILVKLSREGGGQQRRLASGFAVRLFRERAETLAEELHGFGRHVPRQTPPARVSLGDARSLAPIADASVDAVVTSPPYPGVYDYLEHHALRLRWLGLDARDFAGKEIGSRRELGKLGKKGLDRWKRDFGASLAEMARVLVPGGSAILLVADSVLGAVPLYADDLAAELAPAAGLGLVSVASQRRPHFHGPTQAAFRSRPRREHALLFRR